VLLDATGKPRVPNGSLGFRYGEAGAGRWNLDLGEIDPLLTLSEHQSEAVALDLPRFDVGETEGGATIRRGVPALRVGGRLVTTVFDLLLAQYAVPRPGLPGEWPSGYDDDHPYTAVWQERITSVPATAAIRVAREFAQNAELSHGRSMICMGAGTNHWYHSERARDLSRAQVGLVSSLLSTVPSRAVTAERNRRLRCGEHRPQQLIAKRPPIEIAQQLGDVITAGNIGPAFCRWCPRSHRFGFAGELKSAYTTRFMTLLRPHPKLF